MGGLNHATAERDRNGSPEDSLLECGIMVRTDLFVQQEAETEVNTQGLTRKSSPENAISAAERV